MSLLLGGLLFIAIVLIILGIVKKKRPIAYTGLLLLVLCIIAVFSLGFLISNM